MAKIITKTKNQEETQLLGTSLAKEILKIKNNNSLIIFLTGDLGAGKTVLTKGILRGLGFKGIVKSPTFTISEIYEINKLTIYHFDLFRIENPIELLHIGIEEYLIQKNSFSIFEWPEKAITILPKPDLNIKIDHRGTNDPNSRKISIETEITLQTQCDNNVAKEM